MLKVWGTEAQKRRLMELLVSNHRIQVSIQLLNLEHKYLGDLSTKLLGGQVTIDSSAEESTRALSVELLDPLKTLKLDSDSPEDGSMYISRMFKVIYTVISMDNKDRFDIPIFCGPLSKVTRNGPILAVEALGKEKLAMSSVWNGRTYKKGMRRTEVIKSILTDLAGESNSRVQVENRKAKLPKNMSLNYESINWVMAKKIARGLGLQLFYDGRGVARGRRVPSRAVYTFQEKGSLLSQPQVSYDASAAVNSVRVIGAKPKKAKKKISFRVVAPRVHPLSPWRLGRNNKPRYLTEVIQDDSIKSSKEAARIGKARLKSALAESVEVAFDSLPIPMLEEGDKCLVKTSDFHGSFRLTKMTIPLTADGTSSIGYIRKASMSKRQIKIRNINKKRRKR